MLTSVWSQGLDTHTDAILFLFLMRYKVRRMFKRASTPDGVILILYSR